MDSFLRRRHWRTVLKHPIGLVRTASAVPTVQIAGCQIAKGTLFTLKVTLLTLEPIPTLFKFLIRIRVADWPSPQTQLVNHFGQFLSFTTQ